MDVRLERRLQGHLASARSGRDRTRCGHWKRALLHDGVSPVLTVIETGSGEDWSAVEIRWIAFYRKAGHPLLNHTEGGEGSCSRLYLINNVKDRPPQAGTVLEDLGVALELPRLGNR